MFFNIVTIVLFACWVLYWRVEEYKTEKAKPKQNYWSAYKFVSWLFIMSVFVLVFAQLSGFSFLPFITNFAIQIIGIVVVLIGMGISVSARIALSTNWSNAFDYQVKQKHELITSGVYQYIRHPIYTGMIVSFIGAEVVAGSWLWISFFGLFVGAYVQAKREEKILTAHFGKEYKEYMKRSKMLIPFIF